MLPADTPDKKLSSAADISALLAETINQVRRGEVDTKISNAVGYLAGVLLQAQNRDELEQRLARLESVLAEQQTDAGSTPGTDEDFVKIEFVNPDGSTPE